MLKQKQSEINLSSSYLVAPENLNLATGNYSARVMIFYKGKLINVVTYPSVTNALRTVKSVSKKPYHDSNKSYQIIPQWQPFEFVDDGIEF